MANPPGPTTAVPCGFDAAIPPGPAGENIRENIDFPKLKKKMLTLPAMAKPNGFASATLEPSGGGEMATLSFPLSCG